MSKLAQKQVVELKDESHKLIFRPELPLINPETVFSWGTWQNILELVEQYLHSIHFQVHPVFEMDFIINDLYFAKAYSEFDFKRAKKLLSQVGPVIYSEEYYDNGPALLIGEWNTQLYHYNGAVRFAVGMRKESEGILIKDGYFDHRSVRWRTTRKEFLKFIDIIEQVLIGQGMPLVCRAFMRVEIPHARIDIQYFYRMPSIIDFSLKTKLSKGLENYEKRRLKIIDPETTITIFI